MKKIILLLLTVSFMYADSTKRDYAVLKSGLDTFLFSKNTFDIKISDQVKNGCLPNPARLKDKIEVQLRKYGFNIDKDARNLVYLTALGYGQGGTCFVSLTANLHFDIFTDAAFLDKNSFNLTQVPYTYTLGNQILSGPKYDMQKRLVSSVEQYSENLFLNISRAKDRIKKNLPEVLENKTYFDKYGKFKE